jgi:hypothetical protein
MPFGSSGESLEKSDERMMRRDKLERVEHQPDVDEVRADAESEEKGNEGSATNLMAREMRRM